MFTATSPTGAFLRNARDISAAHPSVNHEDNSGRDEEEDNRDKLFSMVEKALGKRKSSHDDSDDSSDDDDDNAEDDLEDNDGETNNNHPKLQNSGGINHPYQSAIQAESVHGALISRVKLEEQQFSLFVNKTLWKVVKFLSEEDEHNPTCKVAQFCFQKLNISNKIRPRWWSMHWANMKSILNRKRGSISQRFYKPFKSE